VKRKFSGTLFFCLLLGSFLGLGKDLDAGVMTTPPCAFHPNYPELNTSWYADDTRLYVGYGTPPVEFFAPLSLPNGVTLKSFTAFITMKLSEIIEVSLCRVDLITGVRTEMAHLSSVPINPSDNRQVLSTSSITSKVVNNNKYCYCLRVIFEMDADQNIEFNGAKISY
jgi:hypothetical protein